MYERLTKRDRYGHAYTNETIYDRGMTSEDGVHYEKHYFENETSSYDGKPIDRLCEIEDKIEQGKIVELPCEIGQTVYKVTYPYRAEPKVTEFIVCGFNYCRNAKHKMIMNLHLALKANRKLKHTAKLKDIYFTPEEANTMLKELENEQR